MHGNRVCSSRLYLSVTFDDVTDTMTDRAPGCAPHILLDEDYLVDAVCFRSWAYRFSGISSLSRWWGSPSLNVYGTDTVSANTLDRFEVPIFGRLASSFVDSE